MDLQKAYTLDSEQFALAMHLIGKARSGAPLPEVLAPEYIPPSHRGVNAQVCLKKL